MSIVQNNLLSKESFWVGSEIDRDLTHYYQLFTKKQEGIIKQHFQSIKEYIDILYWFKFVKKYSCSEMAEILHMNVPNVYLRYYPIGWGYPGTYEENLNKHKEVMDKLNALKRNVYCIDKSYLAEKADNVELLNHKLQFISDSVKRHGVKDQSFASLGFKSLEQYTYAFYYLIGIEKLTVGEISLLFGCSCKNINYKLKQMGLNRSHDEAQANIKQRNRRSADQIMRSIRNTSIRNIYKNGLFGSNIENIIRSQFDVILPRHIDINSYGIVVGVNTKNIIPPKEIDIPIIIINNSTQVCYRHAVEVNGVHYHKVSDINKQDQLEVKGWIFHNVWLSGSTAKQIDYGTIENQIEKICLNIKNMIDDYTK